MRADISPIENQRSQTIYNLYNIYKCINIYNRVIQSHVYMKYTCAHMNGCMCLCAKNAIVGFHGSLAFYCCSVLIEVCVVATERPDRGNQGANQQPQRSTGDGPEIGRSVGRSVVAVLYVVALSRLASAVAPFLGNSGGFSSARGHRQHAKSPTNVVIRGRRIEE